MAISGNRVRSVAMLASGLIIVGLIALAPEIVPPAAVAGLVMFSVVLIVAGLRRADRDDSVEA